MERILFMVIVGVALVVFGARVMRMGNGRSAPEWWLGAFFAFLGAMAWALPTAAHLGAESSAARLITIVNDLCSSVGLCLLLVFVLKVFRPDSARAWQLGWFVMALNMAAGVHIAWYGLALGLVDGTALIVLSTRGVILAWAFVETAMEAGRARKRVSLGLTDPLVANRFLLWAIWTGVFTALPVVAAGFVASGAITASGPGGEIGPAVRFLLLFMGGAAAIALGAGWLSFFPPRPYRRWIAGEA